VQAYVSFPPSANEPRRPLKGYQKVVLGPGQRTDVEFQLSSTDLQYFDEGQGRLTTAPGRYTLFVGTSSRDLHDQAAFTLPPRGHEQT
jgi:beta-glucosidase